MLKEETVVEMLISTINAFDENSKDYAKIERLTRSYRDLLGVFNTYLNDYVYKDESIQVFKSNKVFFEEYLQKLITLYHESIINEEFKNSSNLVKLIKDVDYIIIKLIELSTRFRNHVLNLPKDNTK